MLYGQIFRSEKNGPINTRYLSVATTCQVLQGQLRKTSRSFCGNFTDLDSLKRTAESLRTCPPLEDRHGEEGLPQIVELLPPVTSPRQVRDDVRVCIETVLAYRTKRSSWNLRMIRTGGASVLWPGDLRLQVDGD
eukprot:s322_g6.t1